MVAVEARVKVNGQSNRGMAVLAAVLVGDKSCLACAAPLSGISAVRLLFSMEALIVALIALPLMFGTVGAGAGQAGASRGVTRFSSHEIGHPPVTRMTAIA